jgi:signal transduction histidine kinase
VKLKGPKGSLDVRMNTKKLTLVLLNLIKNAATHSGAAEMIISAFPGKSGFVIVSFKDNGLAVCKEIITDAGGKISAFNDGGANIIFTLPIFSEGNPGNESEDTTR